MTGPLLSLFFSEIFIFFSDIFIKYQMESILEETQSKWGCRNTGTIKRENLIGKLRKRKKDPE